MNKQYTLKPNMTIPALGNTPVPGKPAVTPPRQPLPQAVLDAKLATLDPWLLGVLEKLRVLILAVETQLAALETELAARVQQQPRPKGLGELTLATLDGEVCAWGRTPRSPPSPSNDTVGVELGLNCSDRSWCGTQIPGTTQRGDPGRQTSRDALSEARLPDGGERKTALKKKR